LLGLLDGLGSIMARVQTEKNSEAVQIHVSLPVRAARGAEGPTASGRRLCGLYMYTYENDV
jgi:hypothetical protein